MCIRDRTGRAFGGIAVFYDKDLISLSKIPLNILRNNRELEILAVKGRLRGIKREVLIFSCYFPPGQNKKQFEGVMEILTDAISEARSKTDSPWIVVGADWNRYNTESLSTMHPDLVKVTTGPTRKDAVLDYVFTNFPNEITSKEVCFPLESDASKSDHNIVPIDSLLSRPATFSWETHEYLKVTKEGSDEFCNCLLYTSPSPRD